MVEDGLGKGEKSYRLHLCIKKLGNLSDFIFLITSTVNMDDIIKDTGNDLDYQLFNDLNLLLFLPKLPTVTHFSQYF